jgi:hypothetical protein
VTAEQCRFRSGVERDATGESAICGLVRSALPGAAARMCRTRRDACDACCSAAPALPTAWNPVVASLVFQAALKMGREPNAPAEVVAEATRARDRATPYLDWGDMELPTEPRLIPPVKFERLGDLIAAATSRSGPAIRKWAVGVTTAPRRRPTLERCLESLMRAGWEAPHLFIDSPVRVPERFGHLTGTLRNPAIGAWPNHYLALFELTLRHPDADAYFMVQDDALLYDGENIRRYLEGVLWPARLPSIVSLYCPQPYTAEKFGWHRYRRAWVWGALAFVFSRQAAQMYLGDKRVCQHRWRSAEDGLSQIDVLLGWWARRRRIPIWYPTPSLVQHIGETSTLSHDCPAVGPRTASLFAGDLPRVSSPADAPCPLENENVLG